MSQAMSKGKRPEHLKETLRTLLTYLWPSKWFLLLAVLGIITSTISGVVGTYFIRPLINDYVLTQDIEGLAWMLLKIGSLYALGVVSNYFALSIMIRVGQRTVETIRMELFTHIETLPLRFFDSTPHGDLMSRFTNDFDSIQNMFNNSLNMIVVSILQVVLTFVMMIFLSPILTVLTVAMVIFMLFVVKNIAKKSAQYFKAQQHQIGTLNGFIEEHIEGQKVIKVFHHEEKVLEQFEQLNEEWRESSTKAQFYATIIFPVLGNISYIIYALIAVIGGLLVINVSLDIGALASFLQYSRTFTQPIAQASQQVNVILASLAGAERIFTILKETSEIDEGDVYLDQSNTDQWYWIDGTQKIPVVGNIQLDGVHFGYTPEVPILKDIQVWAKPGLKVAFVGATGAGKTTITNLINRFYEITEGSITFDGIPIHRIKKADLRKTISIVLQDTHLFTGSIADNIRYGRLNATDDEVLNAAKLANAHSFIKRLPHGYQTEITGDGASLSQGQRQLLAIARAAVANPKILILDEATSSIDSHTEALISRGMDQLMQGRTSFVIAHRLSTIRNADVIMVMDKGEIIERGDHESLLAKKGIYYQLYTGQLELD